MEYKGLKIGPDEIKALFKGVGDLLNSRIGLALMLGLVGMLGPGPILDRIDHNLAILVAEDRATHDLSQENNTILRRLEILLGWCNPPNVNRDKVVDR